MNNFFRKIKDTLNPILDWPLTHSLAVIVRKFLKLSLEVVVGFFVLGLFLYALSSYFPSFYNLLTKWANSPALPDFIQCKIETKLVSKNSELDAYSFSITVIDPKDSIYDLVFLTNGPGISIYDVGTKDDHFTDGRTVITRRFVSSERNRSQTFLFEAHINHLEHGTSPFKNGEIVSAEECPADIAFKRRTSK